MKPNPKIRALCGAALAFILIASFQNCGGGFEPIQSLSNQSSSTDDDSTNSNPSVTLTESPNPTLLTEKVDGAPREGSILQKISNEKAILKLKPVVTVPAQYYRYKLIFADETQTSQTQKYTPGAVVELPVFTGMRTVKIVLQFFDSTGLEILQWQSATFTVGDVFLVAGQSNAANHGQDETQSENPLNRALYPQFGTWTNLQDPLPLASNWKLPQFGSNPFFGGSPWPTFADGLSSITGTPVGVGSVAWGGSRVSEWLQGGNAEFNSYNKTPAAIVTWLIMAAKNLPGCNFKAVLWHQGESDAIAGTTRTQYVERMIQLRNKFIQETGCQQKWVIANASYLPAAFAVSQSKMNAIRQGQQDLWSTPGFAQGPDTDALISAQDRYDTLHFSVAGLKKHGGLWVEKVRDLQAD